MRLHNIDLLIAEDTPSDAELIRESLGAALAERAHVASDGVEALDFLFCRGDYSDRAFDQPPRLIMLDLKLPKIDGLSVLGEIKRDRRTRAIPVVMLTSSLIDDDVRRAYELGVNSFVQKPMEFDRFRTTVRAIGQYWLTVNEKPPVGAFRMDIS
ncbi:MAG: response regulator [bacterium]